MRYPQWATPVRRLTLASILVDHLAKLHGWQADLMTGEIYHSKCEAHIDGLVREWVVADMEERAALWKEEQRRIHWVPDRRGWGQRFDPVARERFLEHRPEFYLEGVGVDALTLTRRAKVRVPSTQVRLLVDVTKVAISKHRRRKARREATETLCREAVRDWWK